MKKKKRKRTNQFAKDLRTPKYRLRVVRSVKTYDRKKDKTNDQR